MRRLAVALQESGIAHGDRVAFLAPNVHELLEAHFGVPRAGAVLVAINTRLMPEEIAYILEHSGSRILVVHESLRHLVEDAAVERVLVCGDGGDYEAFLEAAGERRARGSARERGRHDQHQLHERHDRTAERRHVHPPRRDAERARGGRARPADPALGLPLDAADVPLQRLVLHLGGDSRERDARLPAEGRPAARLAAARRGGRHASVRRPDGARDAVCRRVRAATRAAGARDDRGGRRRPRR